VFFMYSPFVGKLLQDVLERLRTESAERVIRVCMYGPCLLAMFKQNWLQCLSLIGTEPHQLGIFRSL
jgi:hypothetical protein